MENNNAENISCDVLLNPKNIEYTDQGIRKFQGCPTVAATPGGRIYAGWYAGGTREPHMDNFNLLVYSDDGGKTWSSPAVVIPSNKELYIHALDIQLWTTPNGDLHIYWVQNNTLKYDEEKMAEAGYLVVDGYVFNDFIHSEWRIICKNPDAEEPKFSVPEYIGTGFLRCKPLVLKGGGWIYFNYDQIDERYGYSISYDEGKTFTRRYGGKKVATPFDETMAYERLDGSIRMFARTSGSYIAESFSYDGGINWTDGVMTDIESPNTRFYISRTPSGKILLINNDSPAKRRNMTVYLSDDDGATWKYKRRINTNIASYPDVDFYNGRIYLVYDRERTGAKEILFLSFTEDDIMNDKYEFIESIISKP